MHNATVHERKNKVIPTSQAGGKAVERLHILSRLSLVMREVAGRTGSVYPLQNKCVGFSSGGF